MNEEAQAQWYGELTWALFFGEGGEYGCGEVFNMFAHGLSWDNVGRTTKKKALNLRVEGIQSVAMLWPSHEHSTSARW